jgi:hypothetical protein
MEIRIWPCKMGHSIIIKDLDEAQKLRVAIDKLFNDICIYPEASSIQPLSNDKSNNITIEYNVD